jgi:hypothetical protein
MNLLLSRAIHVYRKYGVIALCKKCGVKLWRKIFILPDIIYYTDLSQLSRPTREVLPSYSVHERGALRLPSPEEMEGLGAYINPDVLKKQIQERFSQGAKLWLLKKDDACMGMVWTIVKTTIEPFYYLIGNQDVHFFNNEIFEPYRGQGLNPTLIEYVLFQMKQAGYVRAYIETSQRNIAEQVSLKKTSFQSVGKAIKNNLGKYSITLWWPIQ